MAGRDGHIQPVRPASVFRLGILAGLLAGSAAAGVLVGFGARDGVAGSLIALGGRQVIGLPAPDAIAIAVGLLRHLLAFLVLGVLAALVAGSRRLGPLDRLLRIAAVVAIAWGAKRVLPDVLLPLAVELPWGPAILYHLVTLVALHLGIRLAFGVDARRGDDGTSPPPRAYPERETMVT